MAVLVWDAPAASRERLCALTMGHARSLSGWDLAGPCCEARCRAPSAVTVAWAKNAVPPETCSATSLAETAFTPAGGQPAPAGTLAAKPGRAGGLGRAGAGAQSIPVGEAILRRLPVRTDCILPVEDARIEKKCEREYRPY